MKTPSDICQVCNQTKTVNHLVPTNTIRPQLLEVIKKYHPEFNSSEGFICLQDLNSFREEYIQNIISTERGDLSQIEQEVIKSIQNSEIISQNIYEDTELTLAQKAADKLASFGGSWSFIIIFTFTIIIWIIINAVMLLSPFDPYPFILLNLCLSTLAAIQAPVILMSQNRMAERDRQQIINDYKVNLKAELEIRNIHEKLDHLINKQMQHLTDIQEIQIDLLNELSEMKKK